MFKRFSFLTLILVAILVFSINAFSDVGSCYVKAIDMNVKDIVEAVKPVIGAAYGSLEQGIDSYDKKHLLSRAVAVVSKEKDGPKGGITVHFIIYGFAKKYTELDKADPCMYSGVAVYTNDPEMKVALAQTVVEDFKNFQNYKSYIIDTFRSQDNQTMAVTFEYNNYAYTYKVEMSEESITIIEVVAHLEWAKKTGFQYVRYDF